MKRIMNNSVLDLHGISHSQVDRIVENFVEEGDAVDFGDKLFSYHFIT